MNTDLFEIIYTTRSMRRLKPDPVSPELIRQILEAGTAAPPGAYMDSWRFLVIRDQAIKNAVAARYQRSYHDTVGPAYRNEASSFAPGQPRDRYNRMLDAADYLADHLHEAPVWIVPCVLGHTRTWDSSSCIYPAVQNMLLAARALGLGATLTTLYQSEGEAAEATLGVPENALLRNSADRLSIGQFRPRRSSGTGGCGVCRSMGRKMVRRPTQSNIVSG